jgi:hypothetical protein
MGQKQEGAVSAARKTKNTANPQFSQQKTKRNINNGQTLWQESFQEGFMCSKFTKL